MSLVLSSDSALETIHWAFEIKYFFGSFWSSSSSSCWSLSFAVAVAFDDDVLVVAAADVAFDDDDVLAVD